ncbi:ABC transporter ATP-binding protein [Enterococcus hulanensis]|uniref:ABC transporter ATP-binding protein n=1 Tax=Enterococcus hulanensis TaxID=2559929 RepID=A0ABU3F0C9_9ENTE|nr:ABC transporter ATP-binding protein [Enterococcus hulanensis]MDT2600589.1 ABC transporter ATP-binding protein [Enterococcus hulanensis]MDT2609673.1 ABC transporter ATP-binding protein [Enterococcus hulanensis]MDT2617699.1 ABC transporter ATP-binding protein [Enterococcus hulanensis]MDT2628924.1 ABC transporter ATP-binding protein [Enterococcus hulanensis]MDT2656264.1 ABC transporter ATP-binding protein [Enterococcus hulanensis]
MEKELLRVEDLTVKFRTYNGEVTAVNNLELLLNENETLGIVGESGSGKSVTSLSIMGLLEEATSSVSGKALFKGTDLIAMKEKEKQQYRGNHLAMIFQEPMTSLNPLHKCGKQIIESMRIHTDISKDDAQEKAIELLKLVGIPAPEQRFNEYPHQMSGGMRQRVMIAMALACDPQLLIADEPTTALDVTIQAQILEVLKELRDRLKMGIILITHDLGVVSEVCDRVIVMYTGKVVEQGLIREILDNPKHPYTEGLIAAIPNIQDEKGKLSSIEGMVPQLDNMPQGCSFHPRCPYAMDICKEKRPALTTAENGRKVRCFKYSTEEETEVTT